MASRRYNQQLAGPIAAVRAETAGLLGTGGGPADALVRAAVAALDAGDCQAALAPLCALGRAWLAGDLEMAGGRHGQAVAFYAQGLAHPAALADDLRAEIFNKLGTAHFLNQDWPRAAEAFDNSARLLSPLLGDAHPDVAAVRNNLALSLASSGDLGGSEAVYHEVLDAERQAYGAGDPTVAATMNNLALLHMRMKKLKSAERLFKHSLSIKQHYFGAGHPSLVKGLLNYASLLRRLGRDDEAVQMESRAARKD